MSNSQARTYWCSSRKDTRKNEAQKRLQSYMHAVVSAFPLCLSHYCPEDAMMSEAQTILSSLSPSRLPCARVKAPAVSSDYPFDKGEACRVWH